MMSLRLLTNQIRLKSRQASNIVVVTSSRNRSNQSNINKTILLDSNSYHITGSQTLVHKQYYTILIGESQKRSYKRTNSIHSSSKTMTLTGSIKAASMDHLLHHSTTCRSHTLVHSEKPFLPRRALILRKFSRLEYERLTHPEFNEEQLKSNLSERGSDYESLKHYDQVHKSCLHQIESALADDMIEFQTVDRHGYTEDKINWADVIVTSGGDGTFLMAASKVITRDKPVIGVNSDPTKSVGHLCLPKEYSTNFKRVIQLLKDGRYQWQYRQRLRITLIGEAADEDPRELNDIRNNHKRTNHYLDQEDSNDQPSSPARSRSPSRMRQTSCHSEEQQRQLLTPNGYVVGSIATNTSNNEESKSFYQTVDGKVFFKIQQIKEKALNEVFVGEALSARVSYFELSINNNRPVKVKSSGLAVCTGTGSTSWNLNMNKLTAHQVQSILKIISGQHGIELPNVDTLRVAKEFNEMLTFPATKPIMAYSIRDPVDYATGPTLEPRGYPKMLEVKSRMQDGCLVLDSRQTYPFNDGSYALIEMYDEDALKTISV